MNDIRNSNDVLGYLIQAIDMGGDFPVSARVLSRIRELIAHQLPIDEEVLELILFEPAMGARILHLANSPRHRRQHPMLTISQATEELGLEALDKMMENATTRQGLHARAVSSNAFRGRLQQCVMTRMLTESLMKNWGFVDRERCHLAAMLLNLGPLLLAYYFPQVYETAKERATARGESINQSIAATLGITPLGLSIGIVHSIHIPQFYREALSSSYQIYPGSSNMDIDKHLDPLARALAASVWLAEAVFSEVPTTDFDALVTTICRKLQIDQSLLQNILLALPEASTKYCQTAEMPFERLESPLLQGVDSSTEPPSIRKLVDEQPAAQQLAYFLKQIEQAARNTKALSNAAAIAVEALAFGLSFNRVTLLFADAEYSVFTKALSLGDESLAAIEQFIASACLDKSNPLNEAWRSDEIKFSDDPLIPDGSPCVAIPISISGVPRGIIYADSNGESNEPKPLDDSTREAAMIIKQALDIALSN